MTTEDKMNLPRYVPQGRPFVRTKNPMRPAWLDALKRPLLVVARQAREREDFIRTWRFDDSEVARVLLTNDLRNVGGTIPLLVLPGGEDEGMIADFCPVRFWRRKGGPVISIPACALRDTIDKAQGVRTAAHFPIETNMEAETIIAIALHRHLDSLNGK